MADRDLKYTITARDEASPVHAAHADAVEQSAERAEQATEGMSDAIQEAQQQLEAIAKAALAAAGALGRIAGDVEDAAEGFEEVADAADEAAEEVDDACEEMSEAAKKAAKEIEKATQRTRDALDKIAVGVAGAAAAAAAGLGVLVYKSVETGAELEVLKKRLEQAGGGAAAMKRDFALLEQHVVESPFQVNELTESWIRLKNFGLDPANGTFQAIIDTAAAAGASQQDLERVTLALGQAWSKEKLQGEEALQLIEAGVPVWQIMADQLGINSAAVQELSSKGKLGRDAIQLLIEGMGQFNAGQAIAQMQSFNGQISNLEVLVRDVLVTISDAGVLDAAKEAVAAFSVELAELQRLGVFEELGESLAESMTKAAKAIPRVGQQLQKVAESMGDILDVATDLSVLLGTMWATTKVTAWLAAAKEMGGVLVAARTAATGFSAALGGPVGAAIIGATVLTWKLVDSYRSMLEQEREWIENAKKIPGIRAQREAEAKAARDALKAWEDALKAAGKNTEIMNTLGLKAQLETMDELYGKVQEGIKLRRDEKRIYDRLIDAYYIYLNAAKNDEIVTGIKAETEALAASIEVWRERNEVIKESAFIGEAWYEANNEHLEQLAQEQADIEAVTEAKKELADATLDDEAAVRLFVGILGTYGPTMAAMAAHTLGFSDSLEAANEEARDAAETFKALYENSEIDLTVNTDDLRRSRPEFISAVEELGADIERTLADAITEGLTGGDWEDILDTFGQYTQRMSGMLVDAFVTDGLAGVSALGEQMGASVEQNPLGTAAVTFGTLAQAYAQGDILGGAISGATAGFQIGSAIGGAGGIVGGVVGAVLGAAAAYFGQGRDDPETMFSIGTYGPYGRYTGSLDTRGHQGFTSEMDEVYLRQRYAEYSAEKVEWLNSLRTFGDANIFSLLGDLPSFDSGGWQTMPADAMATYFRENWLPDAMMNWAWPAIEQAFMSNNVSDLGSIQIRQFLSDLPDDQRMEALGDIFRAVQGFNDLFTDLDWEGSILPEVDASSMDMFRSANAEMSSQLEVIRASWQHMNLVEIAQDWDTLESAMRDARQTEIEMVKQIRQLTDDIVRSIDQQIEGLELGGMDDNDKQVYLEQRIGDLYAQLLEASDPEQVAQLTSDIQSYSSQLAQAYGDQLYSGSNNRLLELFRSMGVDMNGFLADNGGLLDGTTHAEIIQAVLEATKEAAVTANQGFEDEIHDANQALIDELQRLAEEFGIFRTSLWGIGELTEVQPPVEVEGDIPEGAGPNPDDKPEWEDTLDGEYARSVETFAHSLDGASAEVARFIESLSGRHGKSLEGETSGTEQSRVEQLLEQLVNKQQQVIDRLQGGIAGLINLTLKVDRSGDEANIIRIVQATLTSMLDPGYATG